MVRERDKPGIIIENRTGPSDVRGQSLVSVVKRGFIVGLNISLFLGLDTFVYSIVKLSVS